MSGIHQVVIGALNSGGNCFSVGNVDGLTFVACAVGTDVVILTSMLERIQVIPISTKEDVEELVSSVNCCVETGKLVVCHGHTIRIMEPVASEGKAGGTKLFSYRWVETQTLELEPSVDSAQWALDGLRLLVLSGLELILYQHKMLSSYVRNRNSQSSLVRFSLSADEESPWDVVWKCTLPASPPTKLVKCSPDGSLIASCGEGDKRVKVWYQEKDSYSFSFIYVQHPAPVCGFEWRQVGRYMPRRYVQNALITWCEDNTSRIWKEIPNREQSTTATTTEVLLDAVDVVAAAQDKQHQVLFQHPQQHSVGGADAETPQSHHQYSQQSPYPTPAKTPQPTREKGSARGSKSRFSQKSLKKAKTRLVAKLGKLMREDTKRRPPPVVNMPNQSAPAEASKPPALSPNSPPTNSSATMARSSTLADFAQPATANAALVFSLVATIGADSDCLLVPAMNPLTKSRRPFTVHWLNNKELAFTNGAERILAEQLLGEQLDSSSRADGSQRGISPGAAVMTRAFSPSNSLADMFDAGARSPSPSKPTPPGGAGDAETTPSVAPSEGLSSAKDQLDVKLEGLLRQWSKSYDVLYSIHPVDGSLLTWTVEYLDDLWKQAQVSFASRFPDAFPLTDANSLNFSLHTYNPQGPAYTDVLLRRAAMGTPKHEAEEPLAVSRETPSFASQSQLNTILLLTTHENGSLNLWRLSMDGTKQFTAILNVVHQRRMCGHRFHISQVVAHPVLPLLLTASQFTSRPESAGTDTTTTTAVGWGKESELIMWKVAHVGPLQKSGGVRELARVTSQSPMAFNCLAWLPLILPGSMLSSGAGHSPSSCFVASNNGQLAIYQAVVDARGLLTKLHSNCCAGGWTSHAISRDSSVASLEGMPTATSPMHSLVKSPGGAGPPLHVVSTQSTARPGCIIHVGDVEDSEHSDGGEILLLHVFDEALAVSTNGKAAHGHSLVKENEYTAKGTNDHPGNYLVVMVVRATQSGEDRLKMWQLRTKVLPPATLLTPSATLPQDHAMDSHPQSRLHIESKKVCDQAVLNEVDFREGVRVLSCVAAAGHLPSTSLYPACRAPYTLMVACSDDKMRFLKCTRGNGETGGAYRWENWRMPTETGEADGQLEMDGEIYACSSAHSGRFACAFRSAGAAHVYHSNTTTIAENLEVAVFECESSGGVEWLREDTFNLNKCFVQPNFFSRETPRYNTTPQTFNGAVGASNGVKSPGAEAREQLSSLVRIDWVSTEDGSYILTVGIGHLISLFAQVSQNTAQQNIAMMKEQHEGSGAGKRAPLRKSSSLVSTAHASSRLIRWMCIRTLELHPPDAVVSPLPTAMSWVRDGLLVVGMKSEMRIYNQWNLSAAAIPHFGGLTKLAHAQQPHHMVTSKSQGATLGAMLSISRSHSVLDQLVAAKAVASRKPEHVASSRMIRDLATRALSSSSAKLDSVTVAASEAEIVLRAVSDEGLFEASRLANPMLPQYHPKQLIEMLNAGKIKRVKAVLLHVLRALRARQQSAAAAGISLSRTSSIRKLSRFDTFDMDVSGRTNDGPPGSTVPMALEEEGHDQYVEADAISPLPLYALFAADTAVERNSTVEPGQNQQQAQYDSLFNMEESDEDLDEMLMDGEGVEAQRKKARSRQSSGGTAMGDIVFSSSQHQSPQQHGVPVNFTARHSRMLTELLTHTHLPGLSSVDQMHLLAIADTISHFSPNVMDKLAQANAALQPAAVSTLGDSSAAGYATASMGVETVDECGLRFLMAIKQHEYLCLCLPLRMRQSLKTKGMSTAHIIWAFHSDTEMELLSAVPCFQRSQETWEEMRAFGIAWWLKNTNTLRICAEKIAKNAFQQEQDPMDASLFYLAMRKKNVLMHLFKTVSNSRLHDFFREDFTEDKWKKAAFKNAFALMGKQRFQHAAAFFLLGGSLDDALKTILGKLNDLQLAIVVLRLYESDQEKQSKLLANLLREEVLGQGTGAGRRPPSRDPFERSMAYWLTKDYVRAASTLLEEASRNTILHGDYDFSTAERSLSDIFNFYSFLRRHPLVVRQRLIQSGIQTVSTEQFLAHAREMESRVTRSERRLYFRTASAHMASGCPLLVLDVLARLPNMVAEECGDEPPQLSPPEIKIAGVIEEVDMSNGAKTKPVDHQPVDWSAPEKAKEEELQLDWGDDNDSDDEAAAGKVGSVGEQTPNTLNSPLPPSIKIHPTDENQRQGGLDQSHHQHLAKGGQADESTNPLDFMSQHLKFIAALRIMMDELATLASGFEIDGGRLRYELFKWLEHECEVLREICDYRPERYRGTTIIDEHSEKEALGEEEPDGEGPTLSAGEYGSTGIPADKPVPLHEALRLDRLALKQRVHATLLRRRWLSTHQKLIRTLTSYCALHSSQNHRLTSVQMELLLLLLELQRESGPQHPESSVPEAQSFPLLVSSISSGHMFVSSPLHFVQNQCFDILLTIADMRDPPNVTTGLGKLCMLYNLCQGLSACVYQSLTEIDQFCAAECGDGGALTMRTPSVPSVGARDSDSAQLPRTLPNKWPGAEGLISLLAREGDDDTPNLRLLISELYISISMSLFAYAFAIYDARWIYRLCAHEVDEHVYGLLFGGGGTKRLRSAVPSRPPAPPSRSPNAVGVDETVPAVGSSSSDSSAIRAKLFCKLEQLGGSGNQLYQSNQHRISGSSEISCWVPPRKHVVQFYAEKVVPDVNIFGTYDSDEEEEADDDDSSQCSDDDAMGGDPFTISGIDSSSKQRIPRPHDNPNSYAWMLLRLASAVHMQKRIHTFLHLTGFDLQDVAAISPRLDALLKTIEAWIHQLQDALVRSGCPEGFLGNMSVEVESATVQTAPLLRKYKSLIEPNNTPFEYEGSGVKAVRRLWCYLVLQEHLAPYFIRHIFGRQQSITGVGAGPADNGRIKTGVVEHSTPAGSMEVMKLVQREHEPILAFACNATRPGLMVVSTGRELQEMSMERVLEELQLGQHSGDGMVVTPWATTSSAKPSTSSSYMTSRVELDIQLQQLQRDMLRDNDDYQLFTEGGKERVRGSANIRKRPISGVRRLEAHPTLPYYVSGSSDGSILLWEWTLEQPVFTARVAGQYAKVNKLAFAQIGNKFAAVDGDGLLCLWLASQSVSMKKPFFVSESHWESQAIRCQIETSSSSLLATSGHTVGDQNIAIWDTLMPHSKALIHSFVGHPEGATCLAYMANVQSIVSGGKHGEMMIWDLRQRQLRTTTKVFEGGASVRSMFADANCDVLAVGSSDGDIKIYSVEGSTPQLLRHLQGEHVSKGGFSLRQVGSSSMQGVQQLYVDGQMRLFSCGADNSLKFRMIPSFI